MRAVAVVIAILVLGVIAFLLVGGGSEVSAELRKYFAIGPQVFSKERGSLPQQDAEEVCTAAMDVLEFVRQGRIARNPNEVSNVQLELMPGALRSDCSCMSREIRAASAPNDVDCVILVTKTGRTAAEYRAGGVSPSRAFYENSSNLTALCGGEGAGLWHENPESQRKFTTIVTRFWASMQLAKSRCGF